MEENQNKKTTTASTVAESKLHLGKFLPTSRELEEMNLLQFEEWIETALYEIPERKILRNPLSHLKKEITLILKDEIKSDIEKEDQVYKRISYYRKFIDQQARSKK
jgi:hypothetical protein